MSEPAPELLPIAAAFREAGLLSGQAAASRPDARDREMLEVAERGLAEMERVQDVASIKRGFRAKGLKGALAVGKAIGWTKEAVEELFREPSSGGAPPTPDPSPRGGGVGAPAGGRPPRKRDPGRRPVKDLPEDCPVIPLGTLGGVCHYLDPLGQHVPVPKHGAEDIKMLFGPRCDWLWDFHPKFKSNRDDPEGPPIKYAWEAGYTAEALIEACGKRGIFDPAQRLRGVGAWRGEAGELILHCGDEVLFVPPDGADPPAWRRPGYHGEHVYPGADKLPRPSAERQTCGPAVEVLRHLVSWSYEAAEASDTPSTASLHGVEVTASPLILLGWIATAMIGGALEWRTHVALTGGEGTGKSTMQRLVGGLLGRALVQATDATAAGVYQAVGYSSRAAAIDEAENDPNSAKMKNMVELVRNSASGGQILRGSNDARFKAFTARSSFFLSAIFMPPFASQDLTRVATVPLAPLNRATPPPVLDPTKLASIGRALRRRIVDGWPRWAATLEAYRGQLAAIGHDARGCDQWGALLAAADLCLFEEPPDTDTLIELVDLVGRERLRSRTSDATTAQSMVDYLATLPVDAFRGGNRVTVGALVAAACGQHDLCDATPASAEVALRAYGVFVRGSPLGRDWRVILPNTHSGLAQLLERTPYATRPGAASSGWTQAMSRLSGAEREPNSRRYGGRAWSVPLGVFLGEDRG